MSLAIERTKSSRPPQHLSRHHLTKISWHHLTNMIYTGAARGLIARPAQFTRKGAVNPPLGVSDKTRVLRGHDYRYGESLGDFLIAMDGRDRSAAGGPEGGGRGAVTGGITRQAREMGRIRAVRDSPWPERARGQVNLDDRSRRYGDGLARSCLGQHQAAADDRRRRGRTGCRAPRHARRRRATRWRRADHA